MVIESWEWMNSLRLCKMRGAGFQDPNLWDIHDWVHKEAMKDREEKVWRECCNVMNSEEREGKECCGSQLLTSKEASQRSRPDKTQPTIRANLFSPLSVLIQRRVEEVE